MAVSWWNIPFPIFNEQNHNPSPYCWSFTYPPSAPNYLNVTGSSFVFQIKIATNQTFVDGADITIDAIGSMGQWQWLSNVRSVTLGFTGAYPYGQSTDIYLQGSPLAGIELVPTTEKPKDAVIPTLGSYLMGNQSHISFRTSGNFDLTIELHFKDDQTPIVYSYKDFVLPIGSSEAARQNQFNYGVGACAFGAFFFVVIDLIPILRKDTGR